jgi:elongation factor P
MLNTTDLKTGVYFEEDGVPFQVLTYDHIKKGRGNATIKVKVRNLLTGAIVIKSYISGKQLHEADISEKRAEYRYRTSQEYIFELIDDDEEVEIPLSVIGESGGYLMKGMSVHVLVYGDKPIAVRLPIKVTYTVKDAPPDERGNSANASYKELVLETNKTVRAPMFIASGDRIIVDTRTGDYVSRARD